MSRTFLRTIIVTAMLCGATVAFAKLGGPPKGVTGAWSVAGKSAENNCQYCHDPFEHPLNDPSGQLEILDLPPLFDVSTDYPVRVRISHPWNPMPADSLHWGFQLTAVRSDSGTGYGTFTPGPGTQIATTIAGGLNADPSRRYIEHNLSGLHAGDVGSTEWSFIWHSPDYVARKVYFFAAGNSANGDNLSSNDWIFTKADSVTFVNAGVPGLIRDLAELARPSPNPTRGRTEFRFSIVKAGRVDLAIYDLTGRRVRTVVHTIRAAGPGLATWDGRDEAGLRLANGLYFARLAAPGALPRVQKITLAR